MMKVIALTSANEAAMQAVATHLLQIAGARRLQLSVLVGIDSASGASAVFRGNGELWRVGEDASKPELDLLVDRALDDSSDQRLQHDVDQALGRFLNRPSQVRA